MSDVRHAVTAARVASVLLVATLVMATAPALGLSADHGARAGGLSASAVGGRPSTADGDALVSGQTTLPALPDTVGAVVGIRYSAPWIYALLRPAARQPDVTSSLLLRTRDDGSVPWTSVVDPATGQRARSTKVPLVRGEDVVITDPVADAPYDEGCLQRPLGRDVAPWPCPRLTLLDGAGLLAGVEAEETRIRDLATGAVIRTIPSTSIAGFNDGTIWTVAPGGCCLEQIDVRTGRSTSRVELPDHCNGPGFRSVDGGSATVPLVADSAIAQCGSNLVAVSLDSRFLPLAMPLRSKLFGPTFALDSGTNDGSLSVVDLAAGGRSAPVEGTFAYPEQDGGDSFVVQSVRQIRVVRVAPLDPATHPDVTAPSVQITSRPIPVRTLADVGDSLFFGWYGLDAGPAGSTRLAYEWATVPITSRGARPTAPGPLLSTTWEPGISIDDPARLSSGAWREAGLCFFVRAVDTSGNRSSWARSCTFATGTPPDVWWESLTVAGKGSLIERGHRLTWSGLDEGPVQFLLERREAPATGGFGPVTHLGPTAARMTQRRTAQGVTTCYRLRAVDSYGTVSPLAVTRDTSRLVDNCVTTPIDDRRLRYRGAVRHRASRSAVLGTLTTLQRGSKAMVRLTGVRALQVRTHLSGPCPRVAVNGRAIRSRCGFWVGENNMVYPLVSFDRPLSGRFELSPPTDTLEPLIIDAISAVRRP